MKQSLACKKDSKGTCEFQPVRHRSEEEPQRGLIRFYTDKKKAGYIASFFNSEDAARDRGNARIRVCVPKGCDEIVFPLARSLENVTESEFRRMTVKWWKELDAKGKHRWDLE